MESSLTPGLLIAVVGPSGVGKDSVMDGIIAAQPTLKRVRRTITRAPGLGGESYHSVSVDAFLRAKQRGAFALHWVAHGLHYGIPAKTLEDVQSGQDCLVNLSRSVVRDTVAMVERLIVLNITASPEVLADRLAARGRESAQDIAQRLQREPVRMAVEGPVFEINNDGPLEDAVSQAIHILATKRV